MHARWWLHKTNSREFLWFSLNHIGYFRSLIRGDLRRHSMERALERAFLGLPHIAAPGIRLESGRYWPASGLAGAQRRAEQMPAVSGQHRVVHL